MFPLILQCQIEPVYRAENATTILQARPYAGLPAFGGRSFSLSVSLQAVGWRACPPLADCVG